MKVCPSRRVVDHILLCLLTHPQCCHFVFDVMYVYWWRQDRPDGRSSCFQTYIIATTMYTEFLVLLNVSHYKLVLFFCFWSKFAIHVTLKIALPYIE